MPNRILFLFLVLFVSAFAAADPAVWKVAASPGLESYYPLLRSLYRDLGYTVEFEVMPNERALQQVNKGALDSQVGRIAGGVADYPNLVETKEPLSVIHLQAWIGRAPPLITVSPSVLSGLKIGGLVGNKLTQTYVEGRGLIVQWVPTQEALASMLQARRLDVVLLISAFTDSPVSRIGTLALPSLASAPVFHVLNMEKSALGERFDRLLRQYKSDGRYDRLFLSDTTRP